MITHRAVKTAIHEGLEPLFDRAEREGLWFYSSYQGLWFSPKQLRAAQADGRFVWGAVNWILRDPNEQIEAAEHAVTAAQRELERVRFDIERERKGA